MKNLIELRPAAQKFLKKLRDAELRQRITRALDSLSENPKPHGHKKLSVSSSEDIYRIRVGHYRIIYQITDTAVVILAFGHRREIYRLFF